MKEFLEHHIFEELEPDHDGRELYIFKKHTGKNSKAVMSKVKNAIENVEKRLKKERLKRLQNNIKSTKSKG
jgi:hypothetical protein